MAVLHGACACLMLMMAAVANGQKPGDLNPVSHLDKAWQGRPYYLEENLLRSNITEREPGVPLELRIAVLDKDCRPLNGTFVDIWSCNSTGVYSGYTMPSGHHPKGGKGGPRGTDMARPRPPHPPHPRPPHPPHPPHPKKSNNLTFLRGTVISDSKGLAVFQTIVPGWYPGRAVHIHVKIHVPYNTSTNTTEEYQDSHVVHTGQFFMPEPVLSAVEVMEPYVQHNGTARVRNAHDMDYRGDVRQLLSLSEVHAGNISAGLIADIIAVVNPKATYRAAAEDVSASSFEAVDGNSFVIIGADGARALQLEAW
eukprot:jgi/Astpho2/4892/Aster-x1264